MARDGVAVVRPRGWGTMTTAIWSVCLYGANWVGRAVAWLLMGGRLRLLILGATGAALLFLPIAHWEALLGLVILLTLWAAVRAHVRVVIEGFDDYRVTGAETTANSGGDGEAGKRNAGEPVKDAGTAVLLANRLAMMREVYGFVDNPDGTPTPDRPTGATIQLEDAASALRSAVTTESTVSFGPISIPLGAVMGLLGRFVQAPRLRGAIHGDDHRLIVTAELVMGGQPYAWRVASDIDDPATARRVLESMIHDELAYQVFSDLTLQRQARWPATKYWLLALGNVAESQRRPHNRRLLFKQAESNFMHALSEDERFYLACLNLGIVYRRLADDPTQPFERKQRYILAARRVFERAIDLRPDRWEAYHALAEAHRGTHGSIGALEMITGLCVRALSRDPDRAASARILDLRGDAQAESMLALGPAIASRRRACRLALGELALARLRRASARQARRLEALESLAAQCLVNLAWTSWTAEVQSGQEAEVQSGPEAEVQTDPDSDGRKRRAFRRAYRIATLAVRLSDIDATAHHKLAQLADKAGQLDIAAEELSAAARIAPANPLYAADLALVLAKAHEGTRAAEACARAERLIDFGDTHQKLAQDNLIKAYRARRTATDDARAEALETRKALSDELESCKRSTQAETIAAYKALLDSLGEERDWEAARVRAELGRAIRDGPGEPEQRSVEADPYFREALSWFAARQPDDNRLAELHSDRAQALALRPACSGEALVEAESAVTLNPLRAGFRDVLARVYEVGGDLDSACAAAEHALLLEPDNPVLHHRLAMLKWKLAESLADATAHDVERRYASAQFENALKLYASDQREERRTTSWWLAMSYFAMSAFVEVPAHLRFVLTSIRSDSNAVIEERGLRAAARLWLAKTYRKLGKFLEAEAHAREAVRLAKQLDDEGVRLTRGLTDLVDDDRWPLWVVLALAHMQVAGCHADRDGNLEEADSSLNAAAEVFERMDAHPEINARRTDAYADYQAERGRLLLAQDKPNEAISMLTGSADVDPDEADVFLALARAHARAAEQQLEAEWQTHIRRARAAIRRTREIGGEGHPDTIAAAEIERQLDRIQAAAAELAAATEGNGRPPTDAFAGSTSAS